MSLSLVEVAGASFRTDEGSDALNTEFMGRLGMRKRYLPARLAISRSLAIAGAPAPIGDTWDPGKVIKGDTLFGTGATLSTWTAFIVQREGRPTLTLRELQALVAAHWRRGLALLDGDWNQASQDPAKFIRRLIDAAELSSIPGDLRPAGNGATGSVFTDREIVVPVGEVGEEVASGEAFTWSVNGKGGSPHSAIMGGSGSGKTVTAAAMLKSIRDQAPVPLLAFDFKGDLADFKGTRGDGVTLGQAFQATVIEPPRIAIPLDVLSLAATDDIGLNEAATRFRDSFSRLKGGRLGERQRGLVLEAALRAFKQKRPCQLSDIRDALKDIYAEQEVKADGALSQMDELCRFPLFVPQSSPGDFFRQSWIIKLPPNVPESSRSIIVNLVLDSLDQYLNGLPDAESGPDGARGLRIICMVDEAHQILGTKLPSLSRLIRMSRSKGGAIMLVSQSPDDFSGEEDEFLDQMGIVAAFATNAKQGSATRVLGKGANLTNLQQGEAYVRRRGDLGPKKVKAW
jgi:hypothetical protein